MCSKHTPPGNAGWFVLVNTLYLAAQIDRQG